MDDIIQIDESKKPFIIISVTSGLTTESEINLYFKKMTKFYQCNQGNNLIVIYDLTKLKVLGAKSRQMVGEWIGENIEYIEQVVAGFCYLTTNILHEIILKGIFSYNKSQCPSKIISTIEEGFEWGKQILENKK